MTPEERKLVIELFDRLATLEDNERDPDAERLIRDGLRQAPNAPYALVQTVLVQDEALKRANSPWSGDTKGGDLARQAGLEDIGRPTGGDAPGRGYGLLDASDKDVPDEPETDDLDDGDLDINDDSGGDTDE